MYMDELVVSLSELGVDGSYESVVDQHGRTYRIAELTSEIVALEAKLMELRPHNPRITKERLETAIGQINRLIQDGVSPDIWANGYDADADDY